MIYDVGLNESFLVLQEHQATLIVPPGLLR